MCVCLCVCAFVFLDVICFVFARKSTWERTKSCESTKTVRRRCLLPLCIYPRQTQRRIRSISSYSVHICRNQSWEMEFMGLFSRDTTELCDHRKVVGRFICFLETVSIKNTFGLLVPESKHQIIWIESTTMYVLIIFCPQNLSRYGNMKTFIWCVCNTKLQFLSMFIHFMFHSWDVNGICIEIKIKSDPYFCYFVHRDQLCVIFESLGSDDLLFHVSEHIHHVFYPQTSS